MFCPKLFFSFFLDAGSGSEYYAETKSGAVPTHFWGYEYPRNNGKFIRIYPGDSPDPSEPQEHLIPADVEIDQSKSYAASIPNGPWHAAAKPATTWTPAPEDTWLPLIFNSEVKISGPVAIIRLARSAFYKALIESPDPLLEQCTDLYGINLSGESVQDESSCSYAYLTYAINSTLEHAVMS